MFPLPQIWGGSLSCSFGEDKAIHDSLLPPSGLTVYLQACKLFNSKLHILEPADCSKSLEPGKTLQES